jgi:integrase/recombinase XerC
MVIDDFLGYISKEKRYSKHTFISYQRDLLDFQKFCKDEYDFALREVKSKMVRTWFSTLMEKELAPRTIRRKSSSLKSFYKYLLKAGLISQSPMDGVPLPKVSKKLPKFVEEKNMNMLFSELSFDESYKGVMEKLVMELFYHTGIRLSELIGLKISDINFAKNQLKVLGKRNKERIIPFSFELSETIRQFITYRKSKGSLLFILENEKEAYPKLIYRIVNKHLNRITTIEQKSPHVLRHTFATHMLNNGAELNAIKELLGHVNLSATEVYTHNSLEKIKSVYKQAHPRA